jgi:hypothetical protein
MAFEEKFLDDLRAAVRVSDIIGRFVNLRKDGREFEVVDDPSIHINDEKRIWFDNGSSQEGGDVFSWYVIKQGATFREAVESVARFAGIPLPSTYSPAASSSHSSARRGDEGQQQVAPAASRGRQITRTYDYTDASGYLSYQVCRVEWENEGKKHKSFLQRRPSGEPGIFIWGLDTHDRGKAEPLTFMRKALGKDWSRFDRKKFEDWNYQEKRTFDELPNIEHSLYRLPELIAELREERQDQRTTFLCEGERDCDTLVAWGCVATTNSGGARNFTPSMAAYFRDAADVVICEDNDEAGKKRTEIIAPLLLGVGARVRVLRISIHWSECPKGGDVSDWKSSEAANADRLFEIVGALTDWKPEPYSSKFGAMHWGDQARKEAISYRWLIKGVIPLGKDILIIGPPGSGKSFEATDMALSIARGVNFIGKRVMRRGVVYCCYEGGDNMHNRIVGYRQHHGLAVDADVPFAWLRRPPGLFADEENAKALAKEINELARAMSEPLGAIVVDTHNSATRGSSEVKSEDIAKIQERYALIQAETGVGLWIVGHTNAKGDHRGNEQLYNNIETCLVVDRLTDGDRRAPKPLRDEAGNIRRRVYVRKQREGEGDWSWEFVLHQITVGKDEDGDAVTTMVADLPYAGRDDSEVYTEYVKKDGRFHLNLGEEAFFSALVSGLSEHGAPPLPELNLPASVTQVVPWDKLTDEYRKVDPLDERFEAKKAYLSRIVRAMRSARSSLIGFHVIGVGEVKTGDTSKWYVWPSGRGVKGRKGLVWPSGPRLVEFTPADDASTAAMEGFDGKF